MKRLFLLVPFLSIVIFAYADSISAHPRYTLPEPELWNKSMDLQSRGLKETNKENQIKIYVEAISLLKSYIESYIPDKESLGYLLALCRLGSYEENADDIASAKTHYEKCLKHPQISSSKAIYLKQQVKDFINVRLEKIATLQRSVTLKDTLTIKPY